MNGKIQTGLVIGMLVALVGILSGVVLAEGLERERKVDATVVQVAHWQAMKPNLTDSTEVQVAHWQAMNPKFTDSTVVQVAHWQAMAEIADTHELATIKGDAVAKTVVQR